MPQISPNAFYALPLRVHTFLADVPLHDVWAVDLPRPSAFVTLAEVHRRARSTKGSSPSAGAAADAHAKVHQNRLIGGYPPAARALFRLRFFLGRIFRLEAEPKDAAARSFAVRLTAEDRARSLVEAGTSEGSFRVIYRFENEQLLELQNRTAHAAALSALAETADGYRFYFAVYVANASWATPIYMALIDPFRRWIVYPAMLKNIRASWAKYA